MPTRRKNIVLSIIALVAGLYIVIAATPLKAAIGRTHPGVASAFSPPYFNFSQAYDDGRVLEFEVGMTKTAFFDALRSHYGGMSELIVNCQTETGNSLVDITADTDIAKVYGGGDRICTRLGPDIMLLDATFSGQRVSELKVWYLNTEGT